MKNKLKLTVCALIIFILAFAFMACAEDGSTKYTVSVTGGAGGGEYTENNDCTVTATPDEGKVFVKWVDADGNDVSTSNPYTFKVVEDTGLEAVFGDAKAYTVTVSGGVLTGTGDKTATVYEGQTVSVTAPDSQSRIFKSWLINGTATATANPYVFTATKDMSIVAVVDEVFLIVVSGGSIDGEVSHKYQAGDECTITAGTAPVGQTFVYWYIIDEYNRQVIVSEESVYKFSVTETEKYYAKFGHAYLVTVVGGYISGRVTAPQAAEILAGESCTVKPTVQEGKGFIEWKVNGVTVSTSFEYRFDVTTDVTVEAVFGDLLYLFETPKNNTNQMFSHKNNYSILELDRMMDGSTKKTAFVANVDHVMFYVYTSAGADKNDYVARFIFDQKDGMRLATLDGTTALNLEGTPGNVWVQTLNGYNKSKLAAALELLVGENFSMSATYYFAAQACGAVGSLYAPSGISEIGPLGFGPF